MHELAARGSWVGRVCLGFVRAKSCKTLRARVRLNGCTAAAAARLTNRAMKKPIVPPEGGNRGMSRCFQIVSDIGMLMGIYTTAISDTDPLTSI